MSKANNDEQKTYIAITIGPILRTFGLTATPAALWASSFLFSYIARSIRQKLIQGDFTPPVKQEDFISPYPVYKGENVLDRHKDDGLGLLHDHMIFLKPQGFTWDAFRALRDAVLLEACEKFTLDMLKEGAPSSEEEAKKREEERIKREEELKKNFDYLKQYVMISAVEFTHHNPIMGSSKMLDCAELAATAVPSEKSNPILSFFTNENDDDERNEQIKKRGQNQLGIKQENWQLLYKKRPTDSQFSVKDLPSIATGGTIDSKMKKHTYYAIVRSDGDNMGKLISNLNLGEKEEENEFHTFSGACLAYCERVAAKVREYKGMTVYAGGDDLLAILPCENSEGKTVFDFVREANQVFHSIFLDEKQPIAQIMQSINAQIEKENKEKGKNTKTLPPPSLTWGVTLCHHKYPLYEALEDSANLLFGAKRLDYKDAVNLRLIKHSGQTSAVYIKNEVLTDENGTFFSLLNDILARPAKQAAAPETAEAQEGQNAEEDKKEEENDDILLSCLHTFHEARAVFLLANDQNTDDLFKNMFDADAHENNHFLHESLPRLYKNHCLNGDICALDDGGKKVMLGEKGNQTPDAPEALHYLLRILKFFVEKAGEKE